MALIHDEDVGAFASLFDLAVLIVNSPRLSVVLHLRILQRVNVEPLKWRDRMLEILSCYLLKGLEHI